MKRSNMLRLLALILALVAVTNVLTACDDIFAEITGGTTTSTTVTTRPSSSSTTTTRPSSSSTTTTTKVDHPSAYEDVNNDGFCDHCGYDVVETIDFYNFNDLHGKFNDASGQNGVGKLTSYLEERNSIDEYTVFLSTGDMWQGGAESNGTKGKIITVWMNYLGFEAMTLGNHEFDWGQDAIKANSELAEFP